MESGRKSVAVYDLHLPYPSIDVDGSEGWTPSLDVIEAFVADAR